MGRDQRLGDTARDGEPGVSHGTVSQDFGDTEELGPPVLGNQQFGPKQLGSGLLESQNSGSLRDYTHGLLGY